MFAGAAASTISTASAALALSDADAILARRTATQVRGGRNLRPASRSQMTNGRSGDDRIGVRAATHRVAA
jgi:hypothetical protein